MFTPDIEGMGINIARGLLQTIFTFSKKAFNESLDFCNSSKPNERQKYYIFFFKCRSLSKGYQFYM